VRSFLVAASVLLVAAAAEGASAAPALVPAPYRIAPVACHAPLSLARPLRFPRTIDPGGFELLRERWKALGIPTPVVDSVSDVSVTSTIGITTYAQPHRPDYAFSEYRLRVDRNVTIRDDYETGIPTKAGSDEGQFDALMTLAQLPERRGTRWILPCVAIVDGARLRWRIVSDDVSRGPFPTMAYAKARIRTLASLKINGWSPYMEQVAADPRHPFVAWPNGWTAAQLRELTLYARRFHVELIPEQQTFAHMHETLKWEQLAPLAELPHGYLLAESDPATYAYLEPLMKSVEAAADSPPFVHLGADEPIDLGRGRTPRTPQVFADHVKHVASFLPWFTRPMIWDDAIQQDHAILPLLPKSVVIVTFHYGAEKTFKPYIDTVANAGFDQMVAPGAANWNEIYPDLATSYANVGRFVGEAKAVTGPSRMLGMFMTVWHDDGETLYEATWPAVAYAAASAWQVKPVDDAAWHRTFARAFFGSDDVRYANDLDALAAIRPLIRTTPSDPPDYLFWRDPFDPRVQARAKAIDLAGVRARAEGVMTHLWSAHPPLHPEAAAVMRLGALRYDQLARRLQIGKEARDYYDDARSHAILPGASQVYRSLGVAKYLCWELRDALANIEPLYAAAWLHESTRPGLDHMLAHYRVAENDAQRCADRIDGVMREDYLRKATVPPWDEVMSSAR
jgi:hexosaminidase